MILIYLLPVKMLLVRNSDQTNETSSDPVKTSLLLRFSGSHADAPAPEEI